MTKLYLTKSLYGYLLDPFFDTVLQIYNDGDLDLENDFSDFQMNNKDIQNTIERVVKGFGKYSAKTLSEWSHREESAWDCANIETLYCY